MKQSRFLCLVAMCVLLIGLASMIGTVFAATNTFGCCIDTEIGCTTVYTDLEAQACAENFEFQAGVACEPSALDPTLPVTNNAFCGVSGCCCFSDRFQDDLAAGACTEAGGTFAASNDCASACGVTTNPSVITCSSLGGFWCESQPASSVDFTNSLQTRIDSPSNAHSCYSKPCTTGTTCDDTGVSTYETFCTNGESEDGDCLVDIADSDCQLVITGRVIDASGKGVSNVEITFTNQFHETTSDFVDSFKTYSVGQDGRFIFNGLSDAEGFGYRAEVTDSIYSSENPIEFVVSLSVRQAEITFIVRPKDSGSVKGKVVNNESQPIAGALISLTQSNYYAETNAQGDYEIPLVLNSGSPYTMLVFKEGFLPRKIQNVKPAFVGISSGRYNVMLFSNSCSVNSPPPQLQSASVSKGTLGVTLDFVTSGCSVDGYVIFRCTGSQSQCASDPDFEFQTIKTVGPNDVTYEDTFDLLWDQRYTYRVAGIVGGVLTPQSQLKTVFTGNIACADVFHSGQFCEYSTSASFTDQSTNVRSSRGLFCDDFNNLKVAQNAGGPVVCSALSGTQCVESASGTDHSITSCRTLDACEAPEGDFFGLFSTREICEGPNGDKFCTFDSTSTTVDFCYSCQSVASCADYKSGDACTSNTCEVGSCAWSDTSKELGQGICYDTNKDLCSDCNDPFNAVFGRCTQNVCTQLGACSLSVLDDACLDCEETTCYDYPDQQSCNSAGLRTTINSFDNSISSSTKDQCSLGTCMWDAADDTCFKDSDSNSIDDCAYLQSNYILSSVYETYTYDHCRDDALRPTTTLALSARNFNPGAVRDSLTLHFQGYDQTSLKQEFFGVQDIFFCIAPEGSSNCNDVSKFDTVPSVKSNISEIYTLTLDAMTFSGGVTGRTYQLASGKNVVRYFAKDHANNKEIVNEDYFFVDRDIPQIDIELVRKVNVAERTTDATLYVTANEPVYCYANTQNCDETGTCQDAFFSKENVTEEFITSHENEFRTLFSRTVYAMPDGHAFFNVVCTDLGGNVVEAFEQFLLDADPRIQNPRPSGITTETAVTLAVDTQSDVACRYTQNINQGFYSIPSSQEMVQRQSGNIFAHSADLYNLKNKDYTYYIRCNYEPAALEQIAFTVDLDPPTVIATLGGEGANGVAIQDGQWLQSAKVFLSCEDSPDFGFGCNATKYCVVPVISVQPLRPGNCAPNETYSGAFDVTQPSTIVFIGEEATTGRVSAPGSVSILVDSNDPAVILDEIPSSTNVNSLTVRGSVFDAYSAASLNLEETEDYNRFFSSLFDSSKKFADFVTTSEGDDFEYIAEIDFTAFAEVRAKGDATAVKALDGTYKLLFKHKSPTDYGFLELDPATNKISLGVVKRQGGNSDQEIATVPNLFSGKKTIHISKVGRTISVSLDGTLLSTSALDFSSLDITNTPTSYGALLTHGNGNEPFLNTLKDAVKVTLYTEDAVESPSSVFLQINGRVDEVVRTQKSFDIRTQFTSGVPRHGSSYLVSVFAEDVSGRRSTSQSKTVVYDLAGPVVKSFEFQSTFSAQEDASYVEFGHTSNLVVTAEDDYSDVASVRVEIDRGASGEISQNLVKTADGSFIGQIPTNDLSIFEYDVTFITTDSLGNTRVKTFDEALVIEDRIDPIINIDITNPYYNTPTPTLQFTTSELAQCRVSYADNSGVVRTQPMNSGTSAVSNHIITFSNPLQSATDKNVENIVEIVCNDRNERSVSRNIRLVIDLKAPMYTVRIENFELILDEGSVERDSVSYTAVRPLDVRLLSFANEPVSCTFTRKSQAHATLTSFQKSITFQSSDTTSSMRLPDKLDEEFLTTCIDRAGNAGIAKSIGVIVDSGNGPNLLNVPDIIYMNAAADVSASILTYNSVRSLTCTINNNPSNSVKRDLGSDLASSLGLIDYAFDLNTLQPSLPQGTSKINIACTVDSNSKSGTREVTIHNDQTLPILELTNELSAVVNTPSLFETESSSLVVVGTVSEPATVEIFVEDILVHTLHVDESTGLNLDLPLSFGINYIVFVTTDEAQNIVTNTLSVLAYSRHPSVSFSNALGGSLRNTYSGEIRIAEDNIIGPATISVTNMAGNTFAVPVQRSSRTSAGSGLQTLFDFELPSDLLEQHASKSTKYHALGFEYTDVFAVTTNVTSDTSTPAFVHTETFYYHPLSDSIDYVKPRFSQVLTEDLVNGNELYVSGDVLSDSFIISSDYAYTPTGTLLQSNGTRQAPQTTALELLGTAFNKTHEQLPGLYTLYTIIKNDVGGKTIVHTTTEYDVSGPNPNIFVYPGGDIAYTARPVFNVQFNEPAFIKSAEVTTPNLNETFIVTGFTPTQVIFITDLLTTESLKRNGSYFLNLVAEDEKSTPADIQYSFLYEPQELSIFLVSPLSGVVATENVELIVSTNRNAECRIGGDTFAVGTPSSEGSTRAADHTFDITVLDGSTESFTVRCHEPDAKDVSVISKTFTLSVDTTPPEVTQFVLQNTELYNDVPYIVTYPLQANFTVVANEPVSCRYDIVETSKVDIGESPTTSFNEMTDLSIQECPSLQEGVSGTCYEAEQSVVIRDLFDAGVYDVNVVCANRAGLESSVQSERFQVDVSQGELITIISPSYILNNSNVRIEIRTNIPAETCTYGLDGTPVTTAFTTISADRLSFGSSVTVSLQRNQENVGLHNLSISCTIDGETYNRSIPFIVDTTKPVRGTIVTPDTSASLTRLEARFANFTDAESGIEYYEFAIGTAPYGRPGWNSVQNLTQSRLDRQTISKLRLGEDSTYYWSVRAVNKVLLMSDFVSSLGTYIDRQAFVIPNATTTNLNAGTNSCTDGIKNGDETGVDCGVQCNAACAVGESCVFNSDCNSDTLYCTDDGCALSEGVVDIGGPINTSLVDDSVEEDVPIEILPDTPTTDTSITKQVWTWLWWLFVVILLAMLVGSGYYAYTVVDSSKKEDEMKSVSSSSSGQSSQSSATIAPPVMPTQVDTDRKEALKKALKHKLVEEQNKNIEEKRSDTFTSFNTLKVEKDDGLSEAQRKRALEKRIANLKSRVKQDSFVGKHFEDSSIHSSESSRPKNTMSQTNLHEMHSDVVKEISQKEVSNNPRDAVEKLKALESKSATSSKSTTSTSTTKKKSTKGSGSVDALKAATKSSSKSKSTTQSKTASKTKKDDSKTKTRKLKSSTSTLEGLLDKGKK